MSTSAEKIRPLYSELQGYLSQAPTIKEQPALYDEALWNQYHEVIKQLSQLTGNDYQRFFLDVKPSSNYMDYYVSCAEYRAKLNGLIMNLHSNFFQNEQTPFSSAPSTIMTQTQSTNVQISLVMEVQSLIDKQLYGNSGLEQTEKTFLEKVKEALPTVKSAAELITTLATTANSLGLDLPTMMKALGLHI